VDQLSGARSVSFLLTFVLKIYTKKWGSDVLKKWLTKGEKRVYRRAANDYIYHSSDPLREAKKAEYYRIMLADVGNRFKFR